MLSQIFSSEVEKMAMEREKLTEWRKKDKKNAMKKPSIAFKKFL